MVERRPGLLTDHTVDGDPGRLLEIADGRLGQRAKLAVERPGIESAGRQLLLESPDGRTDRPVPEIGSPGRASQEGLESG